MQYFSHKKPIRQLFEFDPGISPYIPIEYRTEAMSTTINTYSSFVLESNQRKITKNKIRHQWESAILHNSSLTQELCDEIFKIDAKQFEHIPEEYRTDDMISKIKSTHYDLLPHIKNLTTEICMEAVILNQDAIQYVPHIYQTEEMCLKSVIGRGRNLK